MCAAIKLTHLYELLDYQEQGLLVYNCDMKINGRGNRKMKKSVSQIINTVLKAVGAAMGIAVTVLSVMGQLEIQSCICMLGIGLACVGVSLLGKGSTDAE